MKSFLLPNGCWLWGRGGLFFKSFSVWMLISRDCPAEAGDSLCGTRIVSMGPENSSGMRYNVFVPLVVEVRWHDHPYSRISRFLGFVRWEWEAMDPNGAHDHNPAPVIRTAQSGFVLGLDVFIRNLIQHKLDSDHHSIILHGLSITVIPFLDWSPGRSRTHELQLCN